MDQVGGVQVAIDEPLFAPGQSIAGREEQVAGATPAEITAPMAGDDLLPRAQCRSTHAITVTATLAVLMEVADYARMRRMLRGIKSRAEGH